MMKKDTKTQAEAEAKFKRKQGQASEASQAMSDYHAAAHATREKTTRLRKLREAKEAADKEKPRLFLIVAFHSHPYSDPSAAQYLSDFTMRTRRCIYRRDAPCVLLQAPSPLNSRDA